MLNGHGRCMRTFLYWCVEASRLYVWIEAPRHLRMQRSYRVRNERVRPSAAASTISLPGMRCACCRCSRVGYQKSPSEAALRTLACESGLQGERRASGGAEKRLLLTEALLTREGRTISLAAWDRAPDVAGRLKSATSPPGCSRADIWQHQAARTQNLRAGNPQRL
jgi:hypothetical protein